MKTPYDILGLANDATCEDITRAYREQVKALHPDVAPEGGDVEAFIAVKAAYDYLLKNETEQKPRTEVVLDDWAQAYHDSIEAWQDLTNVDGNYRTMGDWDTSELEEKLMKFFRNEGVDARIEIYSRRQVFQADGVNYWMKKGFLEPAGSITGEQSGSVLYRLTEEGKLFIEQKQLE